MAGKTGWRNNNNNDRLLYRHRVSGMARSRNGAQTGRGEFALASGREWVGRQSGGQGWLVQLGHSQAKLESLATAAGLCRRRALTWAWRVWGDGEGEVDDTEELPRMNWWWRRRGGEELDEESGIVVDGGRAGWSGCKQWCADSSSRRRSTGQAVCSMRGSVMMRDSDSSMSIAACN
jgi:hypothetical protein